MCTSCSDWLARRIHVYWDHPKKWFWGTVDEGETDAAGERIVRYDDGEDQAEDLEAMEKKGHLEWLIKAPEWHGNVAACVCYPGVARDVRAKGLKPWSSSE